MLVIEFKFDIDIHFSNRNETVHELQEILILDLVQSHVSLGYVDEGVEMRMDEMQFPSNV